VEPVHLPLAEPVALVFQFIGSDPRVVENVLEIEVRMEFFDIFHIVLDQPAVVKWSVNMAEGACLRNHSRLPFGEKPCSGLVVLPQKGLYYSSHYKILSITITVELK
jgi:hypothetical protein